MKKSILTKIIAVALTVAACGSVASPALAEGNVYKSKGKLPITVPNYSTSGNVTGNGVRLRATAGLDGKIIKNLYSTDIVTIDTNTPPKYVDGYKWQMVNFNGTWGWVADNYLDYTI